MNRRQSVPELEPSAPPFSPVEKNLLSSLSLDSDTAPSAPFLEKSSFENPVTQLELTISARSLLNLDQLTHSDPLCVLFLQDSTTAGEWVEIGRTETIRNDLNPDWNTKFLVDYRFEEKQMVIFTVFDKDCAKYSLQNHDFLGRLECSLGEIVSAPHSKLTRPLKLPSTHQNGKRESSISIIAEEAGDCKKFIRFLIQCSSVKSSTSSSSSIFKPDTNKKLFMSIFKQLTDGSWILLHRTNRVLSSEHIITFPPVRLRYSSVCRMGNLETPLRFQLHQVKHSFKGKTSKALGETVTNFIEISEKLKRGGSLDLHFGGITNALDKFTISDFKIEQQKTFMDYIQDGLQIKLVVAIDFTASNGEPNLHSSLHYKHGKTDNPYVTTLKIVGEILEDYSSSKEFHAYGFGGKGFPLANRANHKFPLNFSETNPICQGIEGVVKSYYRALQRVKLFYPTCFAPIIREVTEIAKSNMKNCTNEYFVLLILTDGIVCDPETTTDALVEASAEAPVSVIIIGIGNEDFTTMEKFDSDEKLLKTKSNKCAQRDIVQFVELRNYVNFKSVKPISEGSKIALARAVLAELPQQVVSWMNLCNRE